MPRSTSIRLGLPLGGINRESKRILPPPEAPDKWFANDILHLRFDTSHRLTPLPAVAAYQNTTNAFRVTKLQNVKWGDGTSDIVRHSRGDGGTGFNGFHEASGGAWVSRSAAINLGTTDAIWGGAVCPGNTGKGYYVFSNRVATTGGPWRWGGAAADATVISGASPGRFVVNFADRCFIFNQLHGGVIQSRRSQWSLPGDSTTWTGTGSGNRTISEIEGDITGVAPLRGVLPVYGPNSLVIGEEQYIPNAPLRYSVFSKGVGNWAPPSLVAEEDAHYFLSQEGFRRFDGNDFQPIGAPIDNYILDNINRSALDNVVSISFKPWHMILWGLPMGSNTDPSEFWMFHTQLRNWVRMEPFSYFPSHVSALAVVDQTSALTYAEARTLFGAIAYNNAALIGKRYIDFAGAGSKPQLITGHIDGVTRILDETTPNLTLQIRLDTQPFTFDGLPLFAGRRGYPTERVLSDDLVVADKIGLSWGSIASGGSTTLQVAVSSDGGQTYTPLGFGSLSLASATGSQLRNNFLHGRTSGRTLSFRFTNVNSSGVVSSMYQSFEDFQISVRRAGESRVAS